MRKSIFAALFLAVTVSPVTANHEVAAELEKLASAIDRAGSAPMVSAAVARYRRDGNDAALVAALRAINARLNATPPNTHRMQRIGGYSAPTTSTKRTSGLQGARGLNSPSR